MESYEQKSSRIVEALTEVENQTFILRYRKESDAIHGSKSRIWVDLEYVNERLRWHYVALDQAFDRIKGVVGKLE